jgi:hypothetical protein
VASPIRLYEGTDLIVSHHSDFWVYVAARGEEAFQQLNDEVRGWLVVNKS